MERPTTVTVPESLRYRDGLYRLERLPRAGAVTSVRTKRILTRTLRVIHRPWFAIWMPTGVAALTTTGRKSGKPRTTFVRAFRTGDTAFLVAIAGENTLWCKNIRSDPHVRLRFRRRTFDGLARDPRPDELPAVEAAFCGRVHPFDYAENMFHRTGVPSRTKILELHKAWLEGGTPLVVTLRSHRGDVPGAAHPL